MKPILGTMVLGLLVFLPALASAESSDLYYCRTGTFTMFHQSKDFPPVFKFSEDGVILSTNGKSPFHGMTITCSGVVMGGRDKRSGDGFCRMVDKDGDIILLRIPFKGPDSPWVYLFGTGKWKGIKGNGMSKRVTFGKSLRPGTYQNCVRSKSTYTLPK